MKKKADTYNRPNFVEPFTPEYNPFLGWDKNQQRFSPYTKDSYPGAPMPASRDGLRLTPFKRTLFDHSLESLKNTDSYNKVDNEPLRRRWSSPATDMLHSQLFGLPANTRGIQEVDNKTLQNNLDQFSQDVENVVGPYRQAIDILNKYQDEWDDRISEQWPVEHQQTGFSRPSNFMDWNDEADSYVYSDDEGNLWQSPVVPRMYLNEMRDKYRSIQDKIDSYREALTPVEGLVEEANKAKLESPQQKWISRRFPQFYSRNSLDTFIEQKNKLMQQYIDSSNIAKLWRSHPSALTAIPYFGYKALPYLWPDNWSEQNQKTLNKVYDTYVQALIKAKKKRLGITE